MLKMKAYLELKHSENSNVKNYSIKCVKVKCVKNSVPLKLPEKSMCYCSTII